MELHLIRYMIKRTVIVSIISIKQNNTLYIAAILTHVVGSKNGQIDLQLNRITTVKAINQANELANKTDLLRARTILTSTINNITTIFFYVLVFLLSVWCFFVHHLLNVL